MNQKGLVAIILIGIVVGILVIIGGGYFISKQLYQEPNIEEKFFGWGAGSKTPTKEHQTQEEQTQEGQNNKTDKSTLNLGGHEKEIQKVLQKSPQLDLANIFSCGNSTDFFSTLPVNLSDIEFIRPLGFIGAAPEHIYPTDHVYFFLKNDGSPNRNPIEVPVYSPGDVWITRIKEIKMQKPVPNSTDYSIYFSPCKEFEAFYFHLSTITNKIKAEIKPPFIYCQEENLGRFESTTCEKEVRVKLSAGELMGTVGKLNWQYSFDLGAYYLKTPALDYANPSRWQKWQQHIVCPLDYFSVEIKSKLKARLGENNVLRTIEPICGEIEQDVKNTAQGVWFEKNAGMYARPELSLIHDFIDPLKGAFAFGTTTAASGLPPDVLYFNPKSSGLVNRDFKDVQENGKVYCYDNLIKQWSYEQKIEQLIILIQLTSPTTLRIEGKKATNCSAGPWTFDTSTDFKR